jgi:TM2 domain-containing membrane protein YozV
MNETSFIVLTMRLTILTLAILISTQAYSAKSSVPTPRSLISLFQKSHPENARIIAIGLTASLGVFGVHRMYMGTDPKVPVFYTLSMGGGGILWLVDLSLLIYHRDISPYIDNPHMFMWTKPIELNPSISQ